MDKRFGQISDGVGSVSFLCSQGFEVLGTLLRVTPHQITFELATPSTVLRASEALQEFRVRLREHTAYSGRATVLAVTYIGPQSICEVSLDAAWLDPGLLGLRVSPDDSSIAFDGFVDYWQKFCHVQPEFKIVVADMQTFLSDLRLWLEQVELGARSMAEEDRRRWEAEICRRLGQRVTATMDALFEKFELHAAQGAAEWRPACRVFARRQLHSLLLCAPFLYRTFQKPLGYAGDYEMVNMITRDPFEGESLYARLVNLWFLNQPPAEAHRDRIAYLDRCLCEVTVRAMNEGRRARILNLGCGPVQEIQRFLELRLQSDNADFTLLDFNEETLAFAQQSVDGLKRRHRRRAGFEFVKKSVNSVLKESARPTDRKLDQQYDFVYCAGLFDYLTDQVCKRLSNSLYDSVRPGGLFVTTNVHDSNPWPFVMDFIMDWHLIYRSSKAMMAVRPERALVENCRVVSSMNGVNIYFEARKPELE